MSQTAKMFVAAFFSTFAMVFIAVSGWNIVMESLLGALMEGYTAFAHTETTAGKHNLALLSQQPLTVAILALSYATIVIAAVSVATKNLLPLIFERL